MKIGVPVLNRGDLLRRLVRSVDVEAEMLVVLNSIGPTDASVEEAATYLESQTDSRVRVSVKRIAGNLGVAGSWNLIMEHFGGECLIANSDIEFAPGVLCQAMARVHARREVVLHHLWAASCFYVTADFPATLGWFDENIYPAYCEDQEIHLRADALRVPRAAAWKLGEHGISHGGSQTRLSGTEALRTYIRKAKGLSESYLTRKWGALPPRGTNQPEKKHPFDNPSLHPADWTLDIGARSKVAALCQEITGFGCPFVCHRTKGGLA